MKVKGARRGGGTVESPGLRGGALGKSGGAIVPMEDAIDAGMSAHSRKQFSHTTSDA